MSTSNTLLSVQNLQVQFQLEKSILTAVDDVSFRLESGKTLGLVGESGCGKSVTSLALMRLIQKPGKISGGQILFQGQDLRTLSSEEMRHQRGKKIAMIFQEPMSALNPVFTVGYQISEVIRLHSPDKSKKQAREMSIDLLKQVGIPSPDRRYDDYPHQLSGGMRQRVMIAMAISCHPALLVADEPTTALDVTIQAQILELLRSLQAKTGMGLLLITHDMGVVAEMCDDVAVMYAGQIVETASVEKLFRDPQHPYTQGLLNSIPYFQKKEKGQLLRAIPGSVPDLRYLPPGCRFQDRCPRVTEICRDQLPLLERGVRCYHPGHWERATGDVA